ncbi:MAG TPA: HAD family phosphatase [Candidatus Sulfotelmatobacter sp.]|jgi:beta-phosphoglucomutase|nr:HAD family phosphatase [Candidatus Sulfotelmatobacter sp.]
MIKAVIFDVDGTMVDSEPIHIDAWGKTLQFYNHRLHDLSPELQANMAGKKPAIIAQEMVEDLHLSISPEILLQKKTNIFMQMIKTDLQGMPGVVSSIKQLKKDGYKLGIGTSLTKDYVDIVLKYLNVRKYFDMIVTGDEIKNGKPHPDTYLTVAKKLGVKPEECIVIEDATSGIKSAKTAGCLCIAIENSNVVPQNTSLADKIIRSLDEIDKKLIDTIEKSIV